MNKLRVLSSAGDKVLTYNPAASVIEEAEQIATAAFNKAVLEDKTHLAVRVGADGVESLIREFDRTAPAIDLIPRVQGG